MFSFKHKPKVHYILQAQKDITTYELALIFEIGARKIPEELFIAIEKSPLARHFRRVES